jgi:hypothetical protein
MREEEYVIRKYKEIVSKNREKFSMYFTVTPPSYYSIKIKRKGENV